MNTNEVNEILKELYQIDPGLKKMEAELKDIIQKLAGNRPESEADPQFKERLKKELLKKLKEEQKAPGGKKKLLPFRRVSLFRTTGITAAAALAILLGIQFFNVRDDGIYMAGEAAPEAVFSDTGVRLPGATAEAVPIESADTIETRDEESPVEIAEDNVPSSPAPTRTASEERKESTPVPAPVAETFEEADAGVSPAMEAEPMTLGMGAPAPSPQPLLNRLFSRAKTAERSDGLMDMEGDDLNGGFAGQEMFNTEEYSRIQENDFQLVINEPLSTFSIDVDTASYANVRRYLTNGSLPPADAVRIEELINYFDYDYPVPEAGGAPFSFNTEVTRCPWNQENLLLQVGLQGYEVSREAMPPSNLVFLLDVSGSMSDQNKLPLLKKSMALLIDTLNQDDRVAIVAYAGAAGLVLPPTKGDEKETILDAMDNLQAGGSTAGGQGIELAYKVALENLNPRGNNRVIIATDGDFNVGASSQGELTRMIEKKREQGIFLTVLGLGMGNYKDSRMESLADAGNGNYAYIDTLNEARKVLVNEMESTLLTIAKDVKIQIEFNPAAAASYRLIGYENRLLENRDFDDDTKDAGEIGAGHTVTALYEIIPTSEDQTNRDLRYQEMTVRTEAGDPEGFAGELGFIKFRYKAPDEDQSSLISAPVPLVIREFGQASANLRFAASVAEWGMILRGSDYLPEEPANETMDDLIYTARGALGQDPFGYRTEFMTLLDLTKVLIQ